MTVICAIFRERDHVMTHFKCGQALNVSMLCYLCCFCMNHLFALVSTVSLVSPDGDHGKTFFITRSFNEALSNDLR